MYLSCIMYLGRYIMYLQIYVYVLHIFAGGLSCRTTCMSFVFFLFLQKYFENIFRHSQGHSLHIFRTKIQANDLQWQAQ